MTAGFELAHCVHVSKYDIECCGCMQFMYTNKKYNKMFMTRNTRLWLAWQATDG